MAGVLAPATIKEMVFASRQRQRGFNESCRWNGRNQKDELNTNDQFSLRSKKPSYKTKRAKGHSFVFLQHSKSECVKN
jgi:hypothetical protein